MKNLDHKRETAILLFIRSENEEVRYKRLSKKSVPSINRGIVRALNARVRQVADAAGMDVVVIEGSRQRGASFGERFVNAMSDVFSLGYRAVIAVGNDCLDLRSTDLVDAASLLDDQRGIVLGPSLDGGAYLIGIRRPQFEAINWVDLPWQANTFFESLLCEARRLQSEAALLPARIDADDADSFAWALASLSGPRKFAFHRLLARYGGTARSSATPPPAHAGMLLSVRSALRANGFRGPPLSFS